MPLDFRARLRRYVEDQLEILADDDYSFELELMLNTFAGAIMTFVIVGLGIFDHAVPIITGIAAYLISSRMLYAMGNGPGPDTRSSRLFLAVLQLNLATLMTRVYRLRADGIISKVDNYWIIVLMSSVLGSQSVFARMVNVPNLWTDIDAVMNSEIAKFRNWSVARNLRAAISIIFGSLTGHMLCAFVSAEAALAFGGIIRGVVVIAVMFQPAARRNELLD